MGSHVEGGVGFGVVPGTGTVEELGMEVDEGEGICPSSPP